ncbi:MAG: Lrp/AsnC ligand binding domain-containing protein [Chloroflexota bacterium]
MVTAYLMVRVQGGTKVGDLEHVRKHPSIKEVTWVLGPYDAVIKVEAASVDALGLIAKELRSCPGVSESVTCLAVS